MEIKVSIIIPVYNAEETLCKTLESAMAQTVYPKEIICIDDGSTDHSLKILETYAEKHEYISIIRQENSGPGIARNKGLEIAKGQYVCFLDADDYYIDCRALDKMVEACKQNHVKICGSFRQMYNTESGKTTKTKLHRGACIDKPDGVLRYFADLQNDFYYQSYIFERKMLEENHIIFPNYRRYQDPPFFLRAMLQAEKFWVMPVELYCFRKNTSQTLLKKMRMADCLKGMRDNFRLAKEYHLKRLQKQLLYRIENNYLEMVLNDEDDEIQGILGEIGSMLSQGYEKTVLIYYIAALRELRRKNYDISEYCKAKNMQEIILYGLGGMAKVFFWALKDSEIKILYGVDQSASSFYDIEIISKYECIDKNAVIVVTPLNEAGRSIAENLIADNFKNVILLSDLIDNMVEEASIVLPKLQT